MQLNVNEIAWLDLGISPLDFGYVTERFLNELLV